MHTGQEMSIRAWRKSSHSNMNGGECVEVGEGVPGLVPVRDSKTPHGPTLGFPRAAWISFVTTLKSADDHPR
ncbi:DUF397 domain-containing protein [Streptomyces oceani]|uniref:DUF397 domain-containing protein n=1 Tax=Streptomyces oceani TaxID=1075402 RepID=A0A1E7JZB7_9ACTN|nr:DUF397 domain-containing protein [Streptomyces oceani]OEU97000.1 hypothetical protein AN216_17165 [Streptomyces oceani]